ncbi:hypothetical protein P7K49_014329, partial [Saguinus oedipus]
MKKLFGFWRHRRQEDQEEELDGIHEAAAKGNVAEVERFLALRSEELNAWDKCCRTPLHWACERGQAKVVTLLLNRNCEVDSCDDKDRTPLML